MKHCRAMIAALLLAVATPAVAADESISCSCSHTLTKVIDATRDNYAGYVLKLDSRALEAHHRFTRVLESQVAGAPAASCSSLVSRYTDLFADHHLFILAGDPAVPELPALETRWSRERVERALEDGTLGDDPLHGLWRDPQGELAVVSDPALPNGRLAALRLPTDDTEAEILGLISRHRDGSHSMRAPGYRGAWQHSEMSLHRDGSLLVFGTSAWGRVLPVPAYKYLGEDDPQKPVFKALSDGIYLLSLPSFMPAHGPVLKTIIEQHGTTIESARGLIIDIRGNTGGNAIYFPLAEYLLDGPIVVNEPNALLASEWNLAYFESFRERLGEHGGFLDAVLERMKEHPGRIVDYRERRIDGPETVKQGPARVVVLQDGAVGSAAEAFLLHVRQSGRVITMGAPSRGNIDYQQVSLRTLGCGEYQVYFGYPLYMRSRNLPHDAVDASGIQPDVMIRDPAMDLVQSARLLLSADGP